MIGSTDAIYLTAQEIPFIRPSVYHLPETTALLPQHVFGEYVMYEAMTKRMKRAINCESICSSCGLIYEYGACGFN